LLLILSEICEPGIVTFVASSPIITAAHTTGAHAATTASHPDDGFAAAFAAMLAPFAMPQPRPLTLAPLTEAAPGSIGSPSASKSTAAGDAAPLSPFDLDIGSSAGAPVQSPLSTILGSSATVSPAMQPASAGFAFPPLMGASDDLPDFADFIARASQGVIAQAAAGTDAGTGAAAASQTAFGSPAAGSRLQNGWSPVPSAKTAPGKPAMPDTPSSAADVETDSTSGAVSPAPAFQNTAASLLGQATLSPSPPVASLARFATPQLAGSDIPNGQTLPSNARTPAPRQDWFAQTSFVRPTSLFPAMPTESAKGAGNAALPFDRSLSVLSAIQRPSVAAVNGTALSNAGSQALSFATALPSAQTGDDAVMPYVRPQTPSSPELAPLAQTTAGAATAFVRPLSLSSVAALRFVLTIGDPAAPGIAPQDGALQQLTENEADPIAPRATVVTFAGMRPAAADMQKLPSGLPEQSEAVAAPVRPDNTAAAKSGVAAPRDDVAAQAPAAPPPAARAPQAGQPVVQQTVNPTPTLGTDALAPKVSPQADAAPQVDDAAPKPAADDERPAAPPAPTLDILAPADRANAGAANEAVTATLSTAQDAVASGDGGMVEQTLRPSPPAAPDVNPNDAAGSNNATPRIAPQQPQATGGQQILANNRIPVSTPASGASTPTTSAPSRAEQAAPTPQTPRPANPAPAPMPLPQQTLDRAIALAPVAPDANVPATSDAPPSVKNAPAQTSAKKSDDSADNDSATAAQPSAQSQSPADAANARATTGQTNSQNADGSRANSATPDHSAPAAQPAASAQSVQQPVTPPQAPQLAAAPSVPVNSALRPNVLSQQLPSAARSGAPAATSDVANLAMRIAAKLKDGDHQFDIRLDPPELGRVDVHLSVDASGRAEAHIVADKQQSLDVLQRDSGTLHKALKDSGLDVSNNSLNFSLKGQDRGDGGAPRYPVRPSAPVFQDESADLPNLPPSSASTAPMARLDIRL
jgi:chemotaxis protein MotD